LCPHRTAAGYQAKIIRELVKVPIANLATLMWLGLSPCAGN
jgi:hypothetical protein